VQNVTVDSARRTDLDQQDLSKVIAAYVAISLQLSEDTKNPVYKFMTENPARLAV